MVNFSTKMTSAVSMVALLASTLGTSVVSAASEFLPYASVLADNAVIGIQSSEAGYRLGDTITRAELAKVTANLGGYTATECSGTVYGDVSSKLGDLCGYIEALAQAGVVSTQNANFRPTASVTRAEMTKMLLGAVGETASTTDAGYTDLNGLGDLAGYVNRANELGCASSATYFRPNATSSRGEAFKMAACAAQLDTTTTEPTVPPSNGSGTTTTPTTSGSTTVAGALSVALDGTAVAQYVPMNASNVKVGTVKLTAGAADVTVNSITVNRSGLGDSTSLTIAVAQSGTIISESRSVNTATQNAIVRLNAPVTIKAGSTTSFEVLVSVSGSANSQHQFAVNAVGTSATVTGTPVTLGLINTTSYVVSTVAVNALKLNSVTSGKNDQSLGTVELRAGSKDVTLNGFTLSKTSGVDMTKGLANIKVYKNAVAVGTATLTSDKIHVSGLNTKVARNDTVTFELRGDVTYVGANAGGIDDIALSISESTDVSGIEDLTGYAVSVSGTPKAAASAAVITLSTLDLTWTKNTTKSITVAPGTSNVTVFDAKLASSASFDVTEFVLSPVGSATPASDAQETSKYNSLTLTVNGVDYDLLTTTAGGSGVYTFNKTADKFRIDAGTPINVRLAANLSNTAGTGVYSYRVDITKVKNVSTGNEVALSGKNITGDNVTVAAPTLKVKDATIAAPSASKIYSNASGLEIGRFGLESTAEEITVREITLTNVSTTGALNDFTKLVSGTNVKLVNVDTNAQASATITVVAANIKLTGMSIKIPKDTTSNFRILVDTQGDLPTSFPTNNKLKFNVAVPSASSSSASSITVTSLNTNKEYTVSVIPPTVTLTKKNANTFLVKITNADADQDITLNSITAQVRPVSVTNNNYAATTCVREEGSSDKCNVATSTGSVPGAAKEFVFASAISISKNSNVTREIYVDSNFVSPTDLQGEVTSVKYNTSVTETYSVIAQ